MAYTRLVQHYDSDAVTLKTDISARVISCNFTLLRQGGCAEGSVTLKDAFEDRGTFAVNECIAISHSAGNRWYLGRIQSIDESTPNEVRLDLFGLFSDLSEILPGGFGGNDAKPLRLSRSDYFVNDPDHDFQSVVAASQTQDVVSTLWSTYVNGVKPILLGPTESTNPTTRIDSFIFRGEETMAQIIRQLAVTSKSCSFGVDEDRHLFFQQKRSGVLGTFQEGTNCERLNRTTDRSLMFNHVFIEGGYIYTPATTPDAYRFLRHYKQNSSITTYGERRIRLALPWIRKNNDAQRFAREFFREYAKPTVRYTFTVAGQDTLIKPWDGQVTVKDASGSTLATMTFDKLDVQFDHTPRFTITLGPEEPNFPQIQDAPDRWEIPDLDQQYETNDPPSITSLPTFTGGVSGSFSSSGSLSQITASEDNPAQSSEEAPAACDPQNEIWQIYVAGTPTGGTFAIDVTVNSTTETIQLAFDDTSAEVDTAFDGHSQIADGDVTVTGGPLPDTAVIVEFTGNLASTEITVPPITDWSSLTGGTGVVAFIIPYRVGVAG